MAVIRRHWLSGTLWILILVVGVATLCLPTLMRGQQPALAQSSSDRSGDDRESLDPDLYNRVQELRQGVALTNQDLAAMGLGEVQAAAVLEGLRTYCEAHAAQLDTANTQVRQAERDLREAWRSVHVGPRDESTLRQVPRLKDAVQQHRQQRQSLWDQAAQQVTARLTFQQRQMWEASRQHQVRGGHLRYVPDLTPQEAQAARQAVQRRARGDHVELPNPPAAQEARRNLERSLPGVLRAESEVLPNPMEQREVMGSVPAAMPDQERSH